MKINIIYKNNIPEFSQDPKYLGFINKEDLKNKSYKKSLKFDWRFTAKKTLNLLSNV